MKLLELNINNSSVLSTFEENRNIVRNIIDACNIWIENCILYQHDIDTMSQARDRGFSMDIDLMIDMYLYGFASRGLSLLSLSQNVEQQLFYGIKVTPKENSPAELLKEHPIIFFNTALVGNQSVLSKVSLTADANDTAFGKGFVKEYGVEFLIEAKYFSDSLNSSGMVTDYKKLFEKGGYYDHCRRRYDLVLSEPENVKRFIGVQDEISVHLIFLSSKPIELEIQDADGVVTFLSLGIFEKYIEGKLITEDDSIVRPVKKI